MKKIFIGLLILGGALLIAKDGWCPAIGGSVIGPQFSTTGLAQVSAQTVTGNAVYFGPNLLPQTKPSDNQIMKYDAALDAIAWEADAGGAGGHTIQDESVSLPARTNLDFQGAGVVASDGGAGPDSTIVTIAGGGSSTDKLSDVVARGNYTTNKIWTAGFGTQGTISGVTVSGNTIIGGRLYVDNTIGANYISGNTVTANSVLGNVISGNTIRGMTFLEIPNGADPDVTVEGQISWDNDDDWMRVYEATLTKQIVVGQKDKVIAFTVCNPDLLTDATFVPIWTNKTGATFNITAIYSFSDVDDADYTLKYTTNATYDFTNLTTIEAITISTNGTGVFYNELTAGIDDTTVETGKTIGFDASADDVDYIHGVICGFLDADVN